MSRFNWMISVLDDLDKFASENELHLISQELKQAKRIAKAEIAGIVNDASTSNQHFDDAECVH